MDEVDRWQEPLAIVQIIWCMHRYTPGLATITRTPHPSFLCMSTMVWNRPRNLVAKSEDGVGTVSRRRYAQGLVMKALLEAYSRVVLADDNIARTLFDSCASMFHNKSNISRDLIAQTNYAVGLTISNQTALTQVMMSRTMSSPVHFTRRTDTPGSSDGPSYGWWSSRRPMLGLMKAPRPRHPLPASDGPSKQC